MLKRWFRSALAAAPLLGALCLPLTPAAADPVNVLTYHNDLARTGANTQETLLTPQNVNANSFGRLFSHPTDGQVYAQPLYVANVNVPGAGVHNLLLVATQHDSIYAFDADNNAGANANPLWQHNFLDPANGVTTVPGNETGSGDVTVEIGITGTPVIGLGSPDGNGNATGTIYLVAKTKEMVGGVAHYVQRLHALDITTGQDVSGSPVLIGDTTTQNGYTYVSGPSVPGTGDGSVNGTVYFNALREAQRPGLVLVGSRLYVAYASHGDNGPYHGWVLTYDANTLSAGPVYNTSPNGGLTGIWMSGEAPAVDTSGNLYFITGNGYFDADNGAASKGLDYGDSVMRLRSDLSFANPAVNHSKDFFSPADQVNLNSYDTDLGSGGLVLLPDSAGSSAHPHLLVGCGKEGKIYLLDRDNLGGFNAGGDAVVQEWNSDGTWSSPAYWNGAIYYQGSGGVLKRFSVANGVVDTNNVAQGGEGSGFPGSTPTISSNGTSDGIAWTIQSDAYGGQGQAILRAHDASALGTELYDSSQIAARDNPGIACKFTVPVVTNGKVYVGTQNQISAYGLNPPALTAAPVIAASGQGFVGDTVTMTDATPNATIRYTTDGSDPTASSTLYIAGFTANVCETIKAKAFATGYLDSAVTARFFGMQGTAGHGNGLTATYFQGVNLDANGPVTTITQVDPFIDFSKPNFPFPASFNDPDGQQDNFSVRWTGQVQPKFTDTYTFTTVSDDGIRMWVNGQEIINDWTYHGPTSDSGTIALQAGQRYDIKVEFFQGGGGADAHLYWSSGCQTSQIVPTSQLYSGAPDAPTGLTATPGDSKVGLSWTASPGANSYVVKRGTKTGGPYTALSPVTPITGTAFTDTGLVNGTTYYYVVDAVNTGGTSVDSLEVSATPVTASTPPAAPTGLTALASDGQVALSWTGSTVANAYKVYRGTTPGGEGATALATGVTAQNYTDTSVTDGTTYYYKVTGTNSAGESPRSNEAGATPTQPSVNYPNGFATATGLQLNGTAQISGSRLRLTDGNDWEAGSAFVTTRVGVGKFVSDFQFQMANPNADGFTFCLQGLAPTAIGGSGGGLGFDSIGSPSLAIKFDLWDNAGEGTNSTGLFTNGATPFTPATDVSPVNLHSGDVIAVHVSYDGTNLSVTETDTVTNATATQTYAVNLPGLLGQTAFAGFTGGTGGAGVVTDILTWTLAPPVPVTPVLTAITVRPATVTLGAAGTQAFTALATDQNGQPLSPQPSVTWSLDTGGVGSVDANGHYTAGATSGTATVRASFGGLSGTGLITVAAPPTAPTGLTATTISSSEIDLAWVNTDNSQTSLKLERSTDGGTTFSPLATLAANVASYQDTGLTPATTYVYRIKAGNASGDSAPSTMATAATNDVVPIQASGLVATAVSATEIDLTFQDNSKNELGFHLYRKTGTGGAFTLVTTIPASPGLGATVAYGDKGLTPGTYYEYHLKAYNAVGEGGDFTGSHATTLTGLPAPTGLAASTANNAVILTWTAPAGVPGVTYNVYRGTTAGGESATPVAKGVKGLTYTDIRPTYGETGYYVVTAVAGTIESIPSNEATAAPALALPAAPVLKAVAGNGAVFLSWREVAGAASYTLYRDTGSGPTPLVTGYRMPYYADTALTDGKTYVYTIVAVNTAGSSPASNAGFGRARPGPGRPDRPGGRAGQPTGCPHLGRPVPAPSPTMTSSVRRRPAARPC